jgi:hypothetical protein
MEGMGFPHDPEEWRLFTDAWTLTSKAVLLHDGNVQPSIPVDRSAAEKKRYETITKCNKLQEVGLLVADICGSQGD